MQRCADTPPLPSRGASPAAAAFLVHGNKGASPEGQPRLVPAVSPDGKRHCAQKRFPTKSLCYTIQVPLGAHPALPRDRGAPQLCVGTRYAGLREFHLLN